MSDIGRIDKLELEQDISNDMYQKTVLLEEHRELMTSIDDHIFDMWSTIIVPYLEDVGSNLILDKLDPHDCGPFWRLFYEKNPVYIHLDEKYDEISNSKS